tara:strand:+ start:43 stop:1581 length:1539 start_codon:yes stop_codon:yes gene_type:complete
MIKKSFLDFEIAETVIVRRPILSYEDITELSEKNVLNYYTENNDLLLGIANASHNVYNEILEGNTIDAAHKYLLRAASRSTPFGLFASVSTTSININNNNQFLKFTDKRSYIIHLNGKKSIKLLQNQTQKEIVINPLVTIYKNFIISSIPFYQHDLTFQYVYINRNKLNSELNEVIDYISDCNSSSQRTINKNLFEDSYINFLLHYGILLKNEIPSSYSKLLIKDNLHSKSLIIEEVRKNPDKTFKVTQNELEQINSSGELHNYNLISFEERPKGELNRNKVINSDFKYILRLLYYISTKAMKSPMNNFIRKYEENYGGQTLPLNKILNPLSGLKYLDMKEKLYDNLFKEKGTPSLFLDINQKVGSFLISLILKGQNKRSVSISKKDIENLVGNVKPVLSPTMSLHIDIFGNYEKIRIKGLSGPSAISMLGRFTYSNTIYDLAKELHEYECKKLDKFEVLDIFNVIDSFSYNVCRRPLIRERNISIYDNLGLSKNSLVASDLFLSIEIVKCL